MKNEIVGIVGKRGQGKSTMLKKVLSSLGSRVLVDTLGEHEWAGNAIEGSIPEQISQLGEVAQARIIPVPDTDKAQAHVEYVCRACFLLDGTTLAIDEVDWYCSPWEINPGINSVIQYGRHAGINLVWTARTPAAVNTKLRSETDALISFRIVEPRWLEALAERFDLEQINQLPELKDHEYLILR